MGSLVTGNIFEKITVKPQFEDFKPESKTDLKQQKNRGIILHKVLSLLTDTTECEIDKAVMKLIILGLITGEQKDDLKDEIIKILSIPQVKEWFDPKNKVMNERDIILPDGSLYRPDKVIIKGNKAVIIDYKTGLKKPEHKTQISSYGDIISRMGYKEIEMYLYYINDQKIDSVK